MAQLIDGKVISAQIKDELKAEVEALKEKGVVPCLAVIQVGKDPASCVYVNNKKKACAEVGINSYEIALPADITEAEPKPLASTLASLRSFKLIQTPP